MKRKLIFGMTLLTLFAGNAKAAIKDFSNDNITKDCNDNSTVCTLTLKSDAVADIVVSEGETITLNLGNYSLISTKNTYSPVDVKGGKLTIEGTGAIKIAEGASTNVPTVNVSEGATLIMNGGVVEGIAVDDSAALYNAGTLTIAGGTIKTVAIETSDGNNGAWGLTNVGTATITGGTFIQANAFSVLSNGDTMTISGGEFKFEGSVKHNSLITNKKGIKGKDTIKLDINEGSFTSADGSKIISNNDNATTTITGGLFTEKNVSDTYAVKKYMGANTIVKLEDTMYVGNSTEKVAANAKSDNTVTVLQGTYVEDKMPAGVVVKNEGDGTVTINGETVAKGHETVSKVEEEKEEEKDNKIVEGVTYETEEEIVLEGEAITETNDVFEAMIKEAADKGYPTILKMFDLRVKDNKEFTKPITITFTVGEEYNSKEVYILHRLHDDSYQRRTEVVKNGKVSITVNELSPFIIALKEEEKVEEEKKDPTPNNAQTSSMNTALYGITGIASLTGLVIVAKKRKENN